MESKGPWDPWYPEYAKAFSPPQPEWRRTDPREAVDKRAFIAILVDDQLVGGDVQCKDVYYVMLDRKMGDISIIGAGDNWPEGWRWTFLPTPTWE